MKRMIAYSVLAAIIMTACKEKKAGESQATYFLNVNGLQKVVNGPLTKTNTSSIHSVSVSDASGAVAVFFPTDPPLTTTGTWYKIASQQRASLNQLATNECSLQISVGSNDVYMSLNSTDSIWIGLLDSKLHVTYPYTWLEHRQVSTAQVIDTITGGFGYIQGD